MKKGMKTGIVLLLVAVAAVAAFRLLRKDSKPKTAYNSATVRRGTLVHSVTATGTIEPIIQVEVGTQVSGIIDRIYVDYNSIVKKGEVIAEIDRSTLEAELESSTATLESNKTEYEYQEKNFARIKGLHDKGMVSDTDFETAEYNYNKAKSAYDKSKADMFKVRQNLGYATITAPIDGVVIGREVEEGQTVAASFETPTLFTIANDLSQMRVIADVDEADIGSVQDGQRATFTVDAYPDDVFEGTVTQVRLQATTESNVVTYEVVVNAPNPDLKLKPGLTANITIYTLQKDGVLLVPSKALRFTPDGATAAMSDSSSRRSKTLWVETGNGIEPVGVTIGETDGIYTEVTGPIKEGDRVVTSESLGIPAAEGDMNGQSNPFMPSPPGQKKK